MQFPWLGVTRNTSGDIKDLKVGVQAHVGISMVCFMLCTYQYKKRPAPTFQMSGKRGYL